MMVSKQARRETRPDAGDSFAFFTDRFSKSRSTSDADGRTDVRQIIGADIQNSFVRSFVLGAFQNWNEYGNEATVAAAAAAYRRLACAGSPLIFSGNPSSISPRNNSMVVLNTAHLATVSKCTISDIIKNPGKNYTITWALAVIRG